MANKLNVISIALERRYLRPLLPTHKVVLFHPVCIMSNFLIWSPNSQKQFSPDCSQFVSLGQKPLFVTNYLFLQRTCFYQKMSAFKLIMRDLHLPEIVANIRRMWAANCPIRYVNLQKILYLISHSF